MNTSIPTWIATAVIGLVVGVGGTLLVFQFLGYGKSVREPAASVSTGTPGKTGGGGMGGGGMGGGGMGGMGAGGGGMGGGGMGGGGMGGMGGGGAAGNSARSLASTVGKLGLLTQGVRIELTAEQRKSLATLLADLDEPEELSEDEAKARLDDINNLFSDEQKKALDSVDLPRRRGGGGGMGGGGMPGSVASGVPGGMGGRTGGAAASQNANPFKQDENANRLKSLRDRLMSDAD